MTHPEQRALLDTLKGGRGAGPGDLEFEIEQWSFRLWTQLTIKKPTGRRPGGAVHEGHAGFSAMRIFGPDGGCLARLQGEFAHVNIFEDPEVREALKVYSKWPTFPQLYVNGELVGGCDIALQMYKSGELKQLLAEAGAVPAWARFLGFFEDRARSRAGPSMPAAGGWRRTALKLIAHHAKRSAVRSASYAAECADAVSHSRPAAKVARINTV